MLFQDMEAEFDHKALWPLDGRDYIALVVGALGLIIAALGGVGGGSILMPVYIIILGFHAKQAVALSNVTILGGAIANVFFAIQRRHPYCDRPLIAWDLILIMEPIIIFGAVLGSFLNKLLPNALLEALLVLVYAYLSYSTISKAVDLIQEEGGWKNLLRRRSFVMKAQAAREEDAGGEEEEATGKEARAIPDEEREESKGAEEEKTRLLGGRGDGEEVKDPCNPPSYQTYGATIAEGPEKHGTVNVTVVKKLQANERHVQPWKPILMTTCFVGMASLRIGQKLVICGSPLYWIIRHVLHDFRKKERAHYPFAKGDVQWNKKNSIKWPLVASFAGLMAGMLGSSGGTIKAPLLIEMGVGATITAATVATMILYTSASATLALVIFGLLPYDYGIVLFLYGCALTAATNYATTRLLGRRRKQSLAMLSIGLVITISTFTMGVQSVTQIVKDPSAAVRLSRLCKGC